jgi:thioredoxin-dependent peroxiredoxin
VARAGEFVDANVATGETLRLLAERARVLAELGGPAPDREGTREAEARAGRFPGELWIGPNDEAIALLRWEDRLPPGRSAELFLTTEFARPAVLRAVLAARERRGGGPLVRIDLPAVRLPAESVGRVLEPDGWRLFERLEMRFPPTAPLPEVPAPDGLRALLPGDAPRLVELLRSAYADVPLDPAFFALGAPSEDEADRTVRELTDGTYGAPLWGASFGVERSGALVAACLVNDFHGPLLSEVMVDPDHRRRGFATAVVAHALAALRASSAPVPRLAVTAMNLRARALYARLGFLPTPLPPDNVWVAFARAGRPELVDALPRRAALLPPSPPRAGCRGRGGPHRLKSLRRGRPRMVAEGEMAPDFEGTTHAGTRLSLRELRGHPVVLYFYPKADTPGCTMESKGFRDHFSELGEREVRVVGVSTDTVEEERAFAAKYGFPFPLVADPDRQIAQRYGVLGGSGHARRVTFLIGPDGRVQRVIDSSLPGTHVKGACELDWAKA